MKWEPVEVAAEDLMHFLEEKTNHMCLPGSLQGRIDLESIMRTIPLNRDETILEGGS